jgi:hypothetical protein
MNDDLIKQLRANRPISMGVRANVADALEKLEKRLGRASDLALSIEKDLEAKNELIAQLEEIVLTLEGQV